MPVMELNQPAQTINHKYEYIKSIIPLSIPVFLVCLVLSSLVFTVVLLLKPQIVPILFGEGQKVVVDGTEVVVDETVSEKKWEIILQSIITAGLVGGIGLLYRNWEESKRKEQKQIEVKRANEARRREEDREKINLQVELLKEFYGSYIQTIYAYKKIRRKFRARSYYENRNLCIKRRDYEQLTDELEDCQLRIQSLLIQLEVREDGLFGSGEDSKSLNDQLESIEKDFRKILVESEKSISVNRNMRVVEPIVIGERLCEFIEKKSKQNSGEIETKSEQTPGEDESEQKEQRKKYEVGTQTNIE
jgi:hypothetical protein